MRLHIILVFTCVLMVTVTLCSGQRNAGENRLQIVFSEAINDSTRVDVLLRYDDKGEPKHYLCHVNTAVCEDGLCRLMIIDVYWDLLGNFLRYDFPVGEALTKLDHQEFSRQDHEQLRKILSDKGSILKDYPAGDLVDRRIPSTEKADAVTSATRVDVRDAVVSGAVFSTYVLWHIVNGRIADRILEHSEQLLTRERVGKMFYSSNFYYQYFALNSIAPEDSLEYIGEVIHLVKNGASYIPYFAVEKVPRSAWAAGNTQLALLQDFASADFELQNAILTAIGKVAVTPASLEILIRALDGLRETQVLKVFGIVLKNRTGLSENLRSNLSSWRNHPNSEIARSAKEILKQ